MKGREKVESNECVRRSGSGRLRPFRARGKLCKAREQSISERHTIEPFERLFSIWNFRGIKSNQMITILYSQKMAIYFFPQHEKMIAPNSRTKISWGYVLLKCCVCIIKQSLLVRKKTKESAVGLFENYFSTTAQPATEGLCWWCCCLVWPLFHLVCPFLYFFHLLLNPKKTF